MKKSERELEHRYRRQFGYIAGYLPRDRSAVDDFHRDLKKKMAAKALPDVPSVAALRRLIEINGIIRMYTEQMIDEVPKKHKQIHNVDEMLAALNHIVRTAPQYTPVKKKQNFFPVSTLFTYMMMTPAGEANFRNVEFNAAIAAVLNEWCAFLDSEASTYVLTTDRDGWLSPSAYKMNKLWEFIIPDKSAPHWGWTAFNAYFHRQIKPAERPIDDPDDPKVIVSANDGTVYKIAKKVKRSDNFWLKGQPYSLVNMLNNTKYVDRFVGGDVFQSFLSGADYHRWHAPVAGVVRYAKVVNGLMFSDAESAGYDPTAGTYSQGYEASVNARGLVFIESELESIGLVCVIPIGITEISSVTLEVKAGDRVKKGDELGYFSYGGSSMALVFQPGAIKKYTVKNNHGNPDDGPPIQVNARIAIAN